MLDKNRDYLCSRQNMIVNKDRVRLMRFKELIRIIADTFKLNIFETDLTYNKNLLLKKGRATKSKWNLNTISLDHYLQANKFLKSHLHKSVNY